MAAIGEFTMVLESALRGRWRVHSPLAGAGQRRRVLGAALAAGGAALAPGAASGPASRVHNKACKENKVRFLA